MGKTLIEIKQNYILVKVDLEPVCKSDQDFCVHLLFFRCMGGHIKENVVCKEV